MLRPNRAFREHAVRLLRVRVSDQQDPAVPQVGQDLRGRLEVMAELEQGRLGAVERVLVLDDLLLNTLHFLSRTLRALEHVRRALW